MINAFFGKGEAVLHFCMGSVGFDGSLRRSTIWGPDFV